MSRVDSRKRPWLAALLAALVTGLGHLYLRRWRRALGWIAGLAAAIVLFVDPATLDAILSGNAIDPLAIGPIVLLGSLSVADAYLLARAQNAITREMAIADGTLTHCPRCRRELDPDLEFCHWCTTEVGTRSTPTSAGRSDAGDD